MARIRSSGGRSRFSACARFSPSTYSITRNGRPSCSTTSWTTAMLGWLMRAAARASCRIRDRMSTAEADAMRHFRATWRCSSVSRPRNTVPMPPAPSRPTTSYRPMRSPGCTSGGASTSSADVACSKVCEIVSALSRKSSSCSFRQARTSRRSDGSAQRAAMSASRSSGAHSSAASSTLFACRHESASIVVLGARDSGLDPSG